MQQHIKINAGAHAHTIIGLATVGLAISSSSAPHLGPTMTAAAPTDRGGEPAGGATALGAAAAAADGGMYFFLGPCLAFAAKTLAFAIALTLALATEEHPSAVTAAYESSITPHRGHRGPLTSTLCVRVTRTVA
jgi:hypothetical protein